MHRVFRFLLIISFPCYAIISIAILVGHAGGAAPHHPGGFVFAAFMAQFSVAAAYNITYAPYVSDYSRYMPRNTSTRGIIAAVFFGASSSAIWLIALGAWLATRLGVSDGLVGLQVVGDKVAAPLGSITAVLSATALLATMGMNAYGAMLTVLTGIDSFRTIRTSRAWRIVTVGALAAVWYAIGAGISTSAVTAVLNSLTLMLYLLVPWTALNLVDYFFVRHGHYAITDIFRADGVYGAWGWRGLTAYFAGFAAEIPFMVLPSIGGFSYEGYIARHFTSGVDYSWLVGLAVSGLVYLLLSRWLDVAAEQSAIQASERELRAIDLAAGSTAGTAASTGQGDAPAI